MHSCVWALQGLTLIHFSAQRYTLFVGYVRCIQCQKRLKMSQQVDPAHGDEAELLDDERATQVLGGLGDVLLKEAQRVGAIV